jgi:formylglycine-generating enzyme required for sulfatase activity
MCGHVWQHCEDWFDADYYKNSPLVDPAGPASGANRALRGGYRNLFDWQCRTTYRQYRVASFRFPSDGIRVVCEIQ